MKRFAPAADRNKGYILEVLRKVLPPSGTVLEVASGSGQHVVHFAREMPELTFIPSDPSSDARASVGSHVREAGITNIEPVLALDVTADAWPLDEAAAVLCINMIHIAPWEACVGLLRGAARILPAGAPVVLYGPFAIDGDYTSESNVAFDERLRMDNPEWGVRELRDVERTATTFGLRLDRVVPRPANNHVVVFRKK